MQEKNGQSGGGRCVPKAGRLLLNLGHLFHDFPEHRLCLWEKHEKRQEEILITALSF